MTVHFIFFVRSLKPLNALMQTRSLLFHLLIHIRKISFDHIRNLTDYSFFKLCSAHWTKPWISNKFLSTEKHHQRAKIVNLPAAMRSVRVIFFMRKSMRYLSSKALRYSDIPSLWMHCDGSRLVQPLWDHHRAVHAIQPSNFDEVKAMVRPVEILFMRTESWF